MTQAATRPRVLVLAENCNPEWPSLPVVGYKYARALIEVADVTIVTHIRNRPNIEKAQDAVFLDRVHYIDNEWIARPLYKLSKFLRGGDEVAWSTSQMMAYLPYIAFERQVLRTFRTELRQGAFDLVHRITPMSPTLPSYAAGRVRQPFILGPLNGNLVWPDAFKEEQGREREKLRRLRGAYRYLPYSRSTFRKADAILAAFAHTIADLPAETAPRTINFPEVGLDETIFNSGGRAPALSDSGPKRFMFAGRLVPYKVPEVAVRAFAESSALKNHILHILGDGPEKSRLQKIVAAAGAEDRVIFEGRKTQAEVADFMRQCDVFVFPSIRELGAGVVVEAMACGMVCMVTDYGAPGHLAADGRGVRVPMNNLDTMVHSYREAMEDCIRDPDTYARIAQNGEHHVLSHYTWQAKAEYTAKIYSTVMAGQAPQAVAAYC